MPGRLHGLDLFAGIGGISLALQPWVRTVAYCEIDRYCQGVLLSRQADGILDPAPIWCDVRTLDADKVREMQYANEEAHSMAGRLKKLTPEQVDAACKEYESGMSLADLAHVYGVTRQAMHDLLKRRIKLRPQKRYGESNHFYRGGKRADAHVHDLVEKAIQSGRLHNPGKCEQCGFDGRMADGRTSIQAHHCDYNKPYDIMWLCQRCHHEWHKRNTPIKKGGAAEPTEIDIISGGFP